MRTALANGRDQYAGLETAVTELRAEKAGVDEWLEEPRLVINTQGVLSTDHVHCKGLEAPVFALEGFRQQLPQEQAVHADKHRVTDSVQLSAALSHGFALENGGGLFLCPVHAARGISAREYRSEAANPAWDFESWHHLHSSWNLLDFTVKRMSTPYRAASHHIGGVRFAGTSYQGLIGVIPSAELPAWTSNRPARRSWGENRQGGCEGRAREGT
ncbi:uncharacterized protein LAESUDRAFT_714511 [Laetiporus sulphureus 93-53]|uniref:Uncharacterized protein n=1 Tax=Laetiporus sulphureus 93-53 TaxID=1314785 RepID=A0A165E348_9APHY|nr:uncharacterized protein LAESUDRAFT_714511 [Laetiporus sulphureus 93-53]KZT06152.1 hypothetical protein LAESUDRAFT_714511 [Laetiporus sulphureus 93-53]